MVLIQLAASHCSSSTSIMSFKIIVGETKSTVRFRIETNITQRSSSVTSFSISFEYSSKADYDKHKNLICEELNNQKTITFIHIGTHTVPTKHNNNYTNILMIRTRFVTRQIITTIFLLLKIVLKRIRWNMYDCILFLVWLLLLGTVPVIIIRITRRNDNANCWDVNNKNGDVLVVVVGLLFWLQLVVWVLYLLVL